MGNSLNTIIYLIATPHLVLRAAGLQEGVRCELLQQISKEVCQNVTFKELLDRICIVVEEDTVQAKSAFIKRCLHILRPHGCPESNTCTSNSHQSENA